MPEPSYVIGSSYSLLDLTEDERQLLDSSPWVFTCNSFLAHWETAGFRPTVWCFGDNNRPDLVDQAALELSAIANDMLLAQRLQYVFLAVEECEREIRQAAADWGVPARFYRRHQPWQESQLLADSLDGRILHSGSTLTNCVNFAWILNPGGEIRLFGNEWGDGFGHFYEGQRHCKNEGLWLKVKTFMWRTLHNLYEDGIPMLDCNRSHSLPAEFRLPTGNLLD